jgi:hypothetical protein
MSIRRAVACSCGGSVSTTKICGDNDFNLQPPIRDRGLSASRPRHFVGPKGRAPKGLEDSAQGFNPGNRRPERFALKGRQIERTNNANVGPTELPNCAL